MRILIVEDDRKLCESLKFQLQKENFTVDACYNGEDGLYFMEQNAYDLVLLDRMLPLMDGVTVLKEARKANVSTPVIFLTALGELHDKITGLDCGADDYMVKPFAFEELIARIRCIRRRPQHFESTFSLSLGDVSYDPALNKLTGNGKICTLSKREGNLLEVFLRNPGQTLPRMTLLTKVWGPDAEVEEGNLDNYIHFLRRRLKSVGSTLSLKTIRGVGYCLEVYHS